MIDILPWNLQKNILHFGIRNELHKELKQVIILNRKINSIQNISNKKKLFLRNCISISPIDRNIEWHIWILERIYDGKRVWNFIDDIEITRWLKICYIRRFKYFWKYGFSLQSIINKIIYF